jgi:DnaJ-class molecular chaperone
MSSNIFVFSDLSSMPFGPLQNKMTYNLELTLEELYHGSQKEFQVQHMTQKGVKSTKYIINIKKGSKHGDNIVVKEGGNYIPELGITEDLVIQVIETEHPKYKRKGNDLFIEEQITLCEALCGLELSIDYLTGPLKVKISDIVKPNQMFQVFGKGMPIKHEDKSLTDGEGTDDYGDLIIDLQIQFPESLGEKQKGYLKKILVQLERNKKDGQLVQAYFYKDKEEVVKEMMNEEEEGMGCIQQ